MAIHNFNTHNPMKRADNRQFLSQKNLAMARLLSEIDTPQDQSLSSHPTPPLLNYPPQKFPPPDSLSNLIAKAQNVVRSASLKVVKPSKPKHHPETHTSDKESPFLTGVMVRESTPEPPESPGMDQLDEQVMKLLRKKTLDDELLQLKKQIKLTDGKLKCYQRQVKGTQKEVYSLAGRYNSYFNLNVPVKASTVDFSGLSYFQLKNFKNCLKKQ